MCVYIHIPFLNAATIQSTVQYTMSNIAIGFFANILQQPYRDIVYKDAYLERRVKAAITPNQRAI